MDTGQPEFAVLREGNQGIAREWPDYGRSNTAHRIRCMYWLNTNRFVGSECSSKFAFKIGAGKRDWFLAGST